MLGSRGVEGGESVGGTAVEGMQMRREETKAECGVGLEDTGRWELQSKI